MVRNLIVKPPAADKKSEKVKVMQVDEDKTLKRELEEEREKANNYLNQLKYLQADFENYKKRTKKELEETTQYGNRRLILELLTVIDELECAVEAGKKKTDKVFLEGVEMIFKKLYVILEREGLSEINSIGKPFDPKKHEAVVKVQSEERNGEIIGEVRKGFMLRNIVIRPSLVKVSVNTSEKRENNE